MILTDIEDMSDAEFIDEAKNYWEDHYDEVVGVKEYVDCDFKKSIKDRRDDIFIDINNNGSTNENIYHSKNLGYAAFILKQKPKMKIALYNLGIIKIVINRDDMFYNFEFDSISEMEE